MKKLLKKILLWILHEKPSQQYHALIRQNIPAWILEGESNKIIR